MPYETLRYEVDESILTITLDRPDKLNAFTTQVLYELIDAFDRADKDDAVKAVIVTGAGRAFCAGAGLSGGGATFDRAARTDRPQAPLGSDGEPDLTSDAAHGGGRVALRIFACLKPVIAAVNGPAVAALTMSALPQKADISGHRKRSEGGKSVDKNPVHWSSLCLNQKLIDQVGITAAFGFLRQPNRPNAPRPVAKSGRAASKSDEFSDLADAVDGGYAFG